MNTVGGFTKPCFCGSRPLPRVAVTAGRLGTEGLAGTRRPQSLTGSTAHENRPAGRYCVLLL